MQDGYDVSESTLGQSQAEVQDVKDTSLHWARVVPEFMMEKMCQGPPWRRPIVSSVLDNGAMTALR